jgi:hypothetical protein
MPAMASSTRVAALVLVASSAIACSTAPAPAAVPEPTSAPVATPTAAGSATASARAPSADAGTEAKTCGALGCRLFDTPEAAFAAVLETRPVVLAVGEAHAQKGTEALKSTTARFTDTLLPMLKDRASDLVLELWVADGKCKKQQKQVAQAQKPVTEQQAATNQNEFVTLGDRSKALGIQPHVLVPSCEEYDRILAAKEDAVLEMLSMIARLSDKKARDLVERNRSAKADRMVVAYGGAMHNDLEPQKGREAFSFGPALETFTEKRYVELDLIVPEFVKDTPAWQSLPWYPHFDRNAHADKVRLYNPRPGSYVLIFPATPR